MNRKVLIAGFVVGLPILVLLLTAVCRGRQEMKSPLVGRPAPPFALRPVGAGEVVSLAGLKGRPIVVNFWATWCIPCAEEHEVLVQGARALREKVQFLGVLYDDKEDEARDYLRRKGTSYPSLVDDAGKTAIAYGVYGVPETFFISPDGTIVEKFVGPLTADTLADNIRRAMEVKR